MATSFVSVPDLLRVLDLTGVFANALLGGAVARRHGFDPVGFAALVFIGARLARRWIKRDKGYRNWRKFGE